MKGSAASAPHTRSGSRPFVSSMTIHAFRRFWTACSCLGKRTSRDSSASPPATKLCQELRHYPPTLTDSTDRERQHFHPWRRGLVPGGVFTGSELARYLDVHRETPEALRDLFDELGRWARDVHLDAGLVVAQSDCGPGHARQIDDRLGKSLLGGHDRRISHRRKALSGGVRPIVAHPDALSHEEKARGECGTTSSQATRSPSCRRSSRQSAEAQGQSGWRWSLPHLRRTRARRAFDRPTSTCPGPSRRPANQSLRRR